MPSETAKKLGEEFNQQGIKLSLHAPYFINFASPDDILLAKTRGYITTGIKFLRNFGADRLIFHPGSAGKMEKLCGKYFCGLRNFGICLTNHRKHGINNCRPQ